jgi:hypothetical protein
MIIQMLQHYSDKMIANFRKERKGKLNPRKDPKHHTKGQERASMDGCPETH